MIVMPLPHRRRRTADESAASAAPQTRVLVTGFSLLPGAPVNPSERLVRMLGERRPDMGGDVRIKTMLLQTAYMSVGTTLSKIGRARHPDIALHFGLAKAPRVFVIRR